MGNVIPGSVASGRGRKGGMADSNDHLTPRVLVSEQVVHFASPIIDRTDYIYTRTVFSCFRECFSYIINKTH